MKLIIQVPCYNEEETLPEVIAGIPDKIDGIDVLETLVIDDGSSDRTIEVARALGVTHVISNGLNKGLARTFQSGINYALAQGADIIVNTDGDHQYDGSSIPDLVRPLIEGRADIVVGDRRPHENTEFSRSKRFLQKFGSHVVRRLSQVDVADAVSGFRAYTREAAFAINVMTTFSYTTETLIHAGQHGLAITSVPVKTNSKTRPSRLFKSTRQFISKQLNTILRSYVMYRSLSAFLTLGGTMLLIGLIPIVRFIWFFMLGSGDGYIQSLILGSMFMLAGYITIVLALLSDSIATNRKLIESTLTRVRKMELSDLDET